MPSLAEQLRPLLLSEEEAAALDVRGRIDAAVLVALYELDGELHAVFTRRRDDMRRHAGEISFPGGRQDVDEEDLRDTALRETEEEIGLPRDAVHLAGALAPTPTVVTNYAIYPFVGTIESGRRWRPSAAEVAEVLELAAISSGAPRRASCRTCSSGWSPCCAMAAAGGRRPGRPSGARRPSRSARSPGCPTRSTTRRSS
jgi:8-oxo-dGTP pyrophosphatase MutT (NUDIX family)